MSRDLGDHWGHISLPPPPNFQISVVTKRRTGIKYLLRSTITEMVREGWYTNAKVTCHPILTTPQVLQVYTVSDEGESRKPRCVEPGRKYEDVDFVMHSLMIYKPALVY